MAYRAGARLAFIDTMQYHPTGAAYPEQILGQLVTEKVARVGGAVVQYRGAQFVYPLETRDGRVRGDPARVPRAGAGHPDADRGNRVSGSIRR